MRSGASLARVTLRRVLLTFRVERLGVSGTVILRLNGILGSTLERDDAPLIAGAESLEGGIIFMSR